MSRARPWTFPRGQIEKKRVSTTTPTPTLPPPRRTMSWDDPNKSYSSYPGMWPSGYDGSGGGGGGGEGLLPDGVHPASAGGEGVVTSASTPSGRPVDWATYEAAAAATAYHHQQHQQHQHHYPQAHAAAGPGGFEGGGDGTLASLIAGVGGMGVGTRGPAAPRGGPAGAHQYMAHQQLHSHHPHHYASGSGGGGGGPGAAGRYISGAGAGAPAQPTPGLRGGGYPLGPRQDGSGGPAAAGGGGGHYLRPGGGAGPGGGIVPGSRRPRAGLGVAGGGGGGVGGGPGGPGEVNYNKIITKKLASATHFYQVLDVIASSVHVFDEVNVATALHRLAKLQPPLGAAGPAQLFSSDPFQRLVGAASRLLPRFGAQAVSNTLWGELLGGQQGASTRAQSWGALGPNTQKRHTNQPPQPLSRSLHFHTFSHAQPSPPWATSPPTTSWSA